MPKNGKAAGRPVVRLVRPVASVAAAAALLMLLLVPPITAQGGQVESAEALLPSGRYGAAAAWVGGKAYVFGGQMTTTLHDAILRYDPVRDEVETMGARLPRGYANMAAASDGTRIHLFGGWAGLEPGTYEEIGSDRIWRYDPATDTLTERAARLPAPMWHVQAVWDGSAFLLLGGDGCADPCPVLRYDPVADAVTARPAAFPDPITQGGAAWTGQHAYYLGGRVPRTAEYRDTVWRYDPAADTLTLLPERLERAVMWAPAFWDGARIHLAGGVATNGTRLDVVQTFDPATGAAGSLGARLPAPSVGMGGAWGIASAFLFGGGYTFNAIYEVTPPEPGAAPTDSPGPDGSGDPSSTGSPGNPPSSPRPSPDGTDGSATTADPTTDATAAPSEVPTACDPTPREVVAGLGAPFGRSAWVQWQAPVGCRWPFYQVYAQNGTFLGEKALHPSLSVYTLVFPPPAPGEHAYLVQAAAESGAPLDRARAARTTLEVPEPGTQGDGDDGRGGREAPAPPVVLVLALMALAAAVVRRRG